MQRRVLLCDRDAMLVELLLDVFNDEGIDVTTCAAIDDVHAALDQYPEAIVLSESWWPSMCAELSREERAAISALAERARLILLTSRLWASRAAELALGQRVIVIPKPFDLDVLLGAVRGWALENSNL